MSANHGSRGSVASTVLFVLLIAVMAASGYLLWRERSKPVPQPRTETKTVSLAAACGDLSLSKGTSEGTAGTMYWHAVITNSGTHACTLTGYPAAFMKDGASLSIAAVSNSLYTPVAVTLAPAGGKAHVVLGVPNAANFDPATTACTAAVSSTLRLYLPGLASPLEAAFGESACPGFSATAVQSGA